MRKTKANDRIDAKEAREGTDVDCSTCIERQACPRAAQNSFCTRWRSSDPAREGTDPNDAWRRGDPADL